MTRPRHGSIAGVRILIVEDEALIAEEIGDRLNQAGCQVAATTDNGPAAIALAEELRPDLILMDVRLKGEMDGIRATELIHERFHVPVVYLTAHSDQTTLERAKAASAFGYVLKPFHVRNLIAAIEVAIDRFAQEQRLEESQLTYSTILGSIADGVLATDVHGTVQFMNPAAERLTGWSQREAQDQPSTTILRIVNAAGESSGVDPVADVLRLRTAVTYERHAFVVGRDGVRVPVDGGVSCIIDSLGRLVGASVTLRDVTPARKAEADLRALAEQLRAVVDTAVDGVLLLDAQGTILMSNPACERLFGYGALEMHGRNVQTLMPWTLAGHGGPAAPGASAQAAVRPRPIRAGAGATIAHRRDGAPFPVEISVGEASQSGRPLFVCVVHDVSERRGLEAALLDAVASEQRRFGTDLHDGLGQDLTGLSLLLSAVTRTARAANSPHAADLGRAYEVAQHALRSCQAIARGLSPVGGIEGGLIAGLRGLAQRLTTPEGPSVSVTVSEVARLGLSAAATDHLYRIAQEALANALRHAHARSITVSLDVAPALVRLEICDDGNGIDGVAHHDAGIGLRTMRYRASIIGATLEVGPFGENGTCIICECPRAA